LSFSPHRTQNHGERRRGEKENKKNKIKKRKEKKKGVIKHKSHYSCIKKRFFG
jgi:hypothetical protein